MSYADPSENDPIKDRLFKLLPPIHQRLDAFGLPEGQLGPLRSLLRLISEQVTLVEADIDQLYADWFVETCSPWVLPYLGELVGYSPVPAAGPLGDPSLAEGQKLNQALVSRAEVANTLRYRRRKGTLALLEELARDVAGWPARAVEAWQEPRYLDVHGQDPLNLLGGPFDEQAASIDVRSVSAPRDSSWLDVYSVALFVWRLRAFSVNTTSASLVEKTDHCWVFNAAGGDQPLFSRVTASSDVGHPVSRLSLPAPIKRWELAESVSDGHGGKHLRASSKFYGPDASFVIWAPGWPDPDSPQPIPADQVIAADLGDWSVYQPQPGCVAVDPELGRILFPPRDAPQNGVEVSYCYGFSAEMGGGEYPRRLAQHEKAVVYRLSKEGDLDLVYSMWERNRFPHAVIEIEESGVYDTVFSFQIGAGQSLQIRASSGARPVLKLGPRKSHAPKTADSPPAHTVWGEPGAQFTMDGLFIFDQAIALERRPPPRGGQHQHWWPSDAHPCPFDVTVRHCTLVPGWSLGPECCPVSAEKPSLCLRNFPGRLSIHHSIVGSISVEMDAVRTEPIPILICDSIVDAADERCRNERGHHEENLGKKCACRKAEIPAIYDITAKFEDGHCGPPAHVSLTVRRSTIFGWVHVLALTLAENSIFASRVWATRRDLGCIRFSFSPPGSETPPRFHCQPELAAAAAEEKSRMAGHDDAASLKAARDQASWDVTPQFTSRRFAEPGYAQLSLSCAVDITRGAEDESEIGAFHDLFQPQREISLRARLAEYTPAATDAGVIFES